MLKLAAAQAFGIKHVLNPNAYRGAFGNDGQAYARDVQDMIETATSGRVAGYISESIQGVGGCTPLADGYLPAVYEVRSALCVRCKTVPLIHILPTIAEQLGHRCHGCMFVWGAGGCVLDPSICSLGQGEQMDSRRHAGAECAGCGMRTIPILEGLPCEAWEPVSMPVHAH